MSAQKELGEGTTDHAKSSWEGATHGPRKNWLGGGGTAAQKLVEWRGQRPRKNYWRGGNGRAKSIGAREQRTAQKWLGRGNRPRKQYWEEGETDRGKKLGGGNTDHSESSWGEDE